MKRGKNQDAAILTNMAGAWMLLNGQDLPSVVIPTMLKALEPYSTEAILEAIQALVISGTGRMTLGQLIERLDAADGRPSAEEAWGTAIQVHDNEAVTVVWTRETAQAWSEVGCALMQAGDRFNASRGFIAKYSELVSAARRAGQPVEWLVCQGWDKELRHQAIQAAVETKRISREYAAEIHPRHNLPSGPIVQAIAGKVVTLISDKSKQSAATPQRVDELRKASSNFAQLAERLNAEIATQKDIRPSVEQGKRIVMNALESGVIQTPRDLDFWMTKANNWEDLSGLQARSVSAGVSHG